MSQKTHKTGVKKHETGRGKNERVYSHPESGGWVVRSTKNGKLATQLPTKEEAVKHARFLAAASLKAVPKKSKLSQQQARIAVGSLFEVPTPRTGKP